MKRSYWIQVGPQPKHGCLIKERTHRPRTQEAETGGTQLLAKESWDHQKPS